MAVNITKRVKLDGKGWRFCPVTANAKRVIVDGREMALDGRFYIDYVQHGKRVRLAAGATPQEALKKAEQQEKVLAAQKAANAAGIELPATVAATMTSNVGRPLRVAVEEYLAEIKTHKKPKTYLAYRTSLRYFVESCHKQNLEEIERKDMLNYTAYLKKQGQSDRSCRNKFENVMSFLKRHEISSKLKLSPHDWPSYVEEDVEIYTQEQFDKFLQACTKQEALWFTFFYESGMREQEVMHASWWWVDFERNVITVRENKTFDWQPKKNKGRQIPVPSSLMSTLKKWHEQCDPECGLVFPTTGCRPKLDFLDECKAIAKRAKLNPADFWLHKFRATRITNWLREGLDLRTVQSLAGHSDLESTSRYLATQEIDHVQKHIEKIAAARNGGQ